jgi:hypothetical protein
MFGSRAALMFVLGVGMAGALNVPAIAQQGDDGVAIKRLDPAAMRQRAEERLKELLNVTGNEWIVLQPKIEKLREAQKASRISLGGRVSGGAATSAADTESPVAVAARELKATLSNNTATLDEIKARLAALHDAKAKADAEVVAAQAELKKVVNERQEAVLVSYGLID